MSTSAISGEQFTSKVGAVFSDARRAQQAAHGLVANEGFGNEQVRIIHPHDKALSAKVQPERRGLALTIVKAHVTTGIAGLLVGVIFVYLLERMDFEFIEWSPWYSYGAGAFFGAMIGMLVGGLISLRPDQDLLIAKLKTATAQGRWSVVVHARDHGEEQRAKESLEKVSDEVVWSL